MAAPMELGSSTKLSTEPEPNSIQAQKRAPAPSIATKSQEARTKVVYEELQQRLDAFSLWQQKTNQSLEWLCQQFTEVRTRGPGSSPALVHTPGTYEEFHAAFAMWYLEEDPQVCIRKAVDFRMKAGDSFLEYLQEKTFRCKKAKIAESTIVAMIIDGLAEPVATHIKTQKDQPKTLEDVTHDVLRLVGSLNLSKADQKSGLVAPILEDALVQPTTKKLKSPAARPHPDLPDLKLAELPTDLSEPLRTFMQDCVQQSVEAALKAKGRKICSGNCFNCGKPGHLARECRSRHKEESGPPRTTKFKKKVAR